MSKPTIEQIMSRLHHLYELLNAGHLEEMAKEIQKFREDHPAAEPSIIGPLIDMGTAANDPKPIEEAIAIFDALEEKYIDSHLLYNIGNAYSSLHKIKLKNKVNIFDRDTEIMQALGYYRKATVQEPQLLDNIGSLYDEIGRPIEALRFYERALKKDAKFGMSLGNKAQTIEALAPITAHEYHEAYLILAHRLYEAAITNSESVLEHGGDIALKIFQAGKAGIEEMFKDANQEARLSSDTTHPHPTYSGMSDFVKFYSRYCLERDLYLNLHITAKHSDASIGDDIALHIITPNTGKPYDEEKRYIDGISFRLNEIKEAYISARLALVQSQFVTDDFSTISQQTLLINPLDYSASNIYVGYLKMAYKEVFSVLDKIGIFLNYYLNLGHPEDSRRLYFNTVWYENLDAPSKKNEGVINEKVKEHGALLYGLFSLTREIKGSDLDEIRNALTHRYLRVFRTMKGPEKTYMWEELTEETEQLFFTVKCAIIYLHNFINIAEAKKKHSMKPDGLIVDMPLNNNQWLDLWD